MIRDTEEPESTGFAASSVEGRALLGKVRAFARPITARALLQLITTLLAWLALLVGCKNLDLPFSLIFIPFLTLMVARTFVLQHDCGHASLVPGPRWNHVIGRILAIITGIAYDAWRTEHDWHHQVQGRLDRRGVDLFNSPMTVAEALQDPKKAQAVEKTVKVHNIAWLGMLALLVDRRRRRAFFMWRPGYSGKAVDRRQALVINLWFTNILHLGFHISIALYIGWLPWLCLFPPAYVLAGMLGSLVFWVQHNYKESYSAPSESWNFKDAALRGSSYLRVPQLLRWFTADVGIHHVHHLNPCVPNYRLEEARTHIPELQQIKPLGFKQLLESFRYHYWDSELQRRLSHDEVFRQTERPN